MPAVGRHVKPENERLAGGANGGREYRVRPGHVADHRVDLIFVDDIAQPLARFQN